MNNIVVCLLSLTFCVFLGSPQAAQAIEDEHSHEHGEEEQEELSLDAATLQAAGIAQDVAGPQVISLTTQVNGRLVLNENEMAHIAPRYPGVLRQVRKRQGDTVDRGEVLAVVESNQNLQPYEVKSPISGVLIKRRANNGEFVSEAQEIFVVADLTELWAELFVFSPDMKKLRLGQELIIRADNFEPPFPASVNFISSVVDEKTQSKVIRAVIPNANRSLFAGQFITADLRLDEVSVPVAVQTAAIARQGTKHVIFLPEGEHIRAAIVSLGHRNSRYTQILAGLNAGQAYFAGNTYMLKAEMDKGKADHQH